MKKSTANALALSAVSALALPQYAEAVAIYSATAQGTATITPVAGLLGLGEEGANWSDDTLSLFLTGSGSHTFGGSPSIADVANGVYPPDGPPYPYLSVDLQVTGRAGDGGVSGTASNRQEGSASMYVYCLSSGENSCYFNVSFTSFTEAPTQIDSDGESASADSSLALEFGVSGPALFSVGLECSEIQPGEYQCSLPESSSDSIMLSGWVQGEALARYPTPTVPEPGTLALFSFGAMGLAAFRRRKTKSE